MSVACKYLTPLKPTPNSKVFRNLHCKFKRLNSFSVSVNGHSENAYLRSLWAPSRHSLHDHLTTAMQTKSTFANVAFADAETPRGRGTLFFVSQRIPRLRSFIAARFGKTQFALFRLTPNISHA